MAFKPAPLFYVMAKIVSDNYFKAEQKRCIRIRNEGGSRSSKTYCFFHLLEWLCSNNPGAGWHIYIYRDTLTNCRDFTLKDFQDCKRIIGTYNPDALKGYGQKPEYNLYGNMVYFRGLEEDVEYPPCQICFINEVMEVSEAAYKAATKRCSMLEVADWNPKYTDHWIFKQEGQPHTWFTHSTFRDNPYADPALVAKYKSWCPWEFEDLNLPEDQRRPNAANTKAGTIDRVQWLVYGDGIRCAKEGLVFPDAEFVDALPEEYDTRHFGLDFGKTVGTNAFVDVRAKRLDGRISIYYDCPIYLSFDRLPDLYAAIVAYMELHPHNDHVIVYCDCAEPQKINDLNMYVAESGRRMTFVAAKKWEGCVNWRIDLMKRHKMLLVRKKHVIKEQENYRYKMVNSIPLNEPEKNGFDHFFDASGYAIQNEPSLR